MEDIRSPSTLEYLATLRMISEFEDLDYIKELPKNIKQRLVQFCSYARYKTQDVKHLEVIQELIRTWPARVFDGRLLQHKIDQELLETIFMLIKSNDIGNIKVMNLSEIEIPDYLMLSLVKGEFIYDDDSEDEDDDDIDEEATVSPRSAAPLHLLVHLKISSRSYNDVIPHLKSQQVMFQTQEYEDREIIVCPGKIELESLPISKVLEVLQNVNSNYVKEFSITNVSPGTIKDHESVRQVFEEIKRFKAINTLKLINIQDKRQGWPKSLVEHAANCISELQNIEKIEVGRIPSETLESFINLGFKSHSISSLSVKFVRLTADVMNALVENKFLHLLEYLTLYNTAYDSDISDIAEFLSPNSGTLTTLSLNRCALSNENLMDLGKTLETLDSLEDLVIYEANIDRRYRHKDICPFIASFRYDQTKGSFIRSKAEDSVKE